MVEIGMLINDRYELLEKIGEGGMANVYRAKCHRLNRFVAIKILKQEYSEDKKFVDKFRAEAQSAAGLSHQNIVSVYDVGEENGLYYIVMELVEGITLKNFIERKGRLDMREATGIAVKIAQGLEAAHSNNIVHRDIKPQNIIISKEGTVKVTDFGIAKAASSHTITSNAMGSVHYISPEQARGGFSDAKSDIYSLGVTLYEMLTGRVPFQGDNTVSVALAHIEEEARPIRDIVPDVSVSLERIVQKCMQKRTERRYISASDLIADLKRSLTDPTGAFVVMSTGVVTDSPTINITPEQVGEIKKAKIRDDIRPAEVVEEEPEDDSDIDPKMEKLMVIGGVVAAIILCIVIVVIVVKGMQMFGGSKDTTEPTEITETTQTTFATETEATEAEEEGVEMVSVIGETREDAIDMLSAIGITPLVTERASDVYAEGVVCAQTPDSGAEVKPGDSVTIVVSTGQEIAMTTVPDVKDKDKEDASTAIVMAGLSVSEYVEEYSDDVEEGLVIRTNPAVGEEVEENSSVVVYISKGQEVEMVTVPSLSDLTEDVAIKQLKALGLDGEVSAYKNNEDVEAGLIYKQSHTPGTEVEKGTTITFTVSLGPKEEEVTYTYRGNVTINDNPFEYEDEEGTITLILTQDGTSTQVYKEESADINSFPLSVTVEGSSESVGKIEMYLDGKLVGSTYSISFKKVKDE